MISFIIEQIKFEYNFSDFIEKSSFKIKSVPKNYSVFWNQDNPIDIISREYTEGDVILMDNNVFNLYPIKDKVIYLIKANENNKSIESILKLIKFLSDRNFNKGNKLIVIGGGIIQDIGAFTSAIYKRGINWVLLPSTLLSMCDSCIGGKTGINHGNAKNQLALFSSPSKVIICPRFIETLSDNDIKSGLGEILKLFTTGGDYFVNQYSKYVKRGIVQAKENYKFLIFGALFIKKVIVEHDEFELNIRKSLNYGHTIGHAIESLSNYNISHGQAVVIGMMVVNKINKFNHSLLDNLCMDLINKEDLKNVNLDGLQSLLAKDKKTIGNETTFVFVDKLGETRFEKIEITNDFIENLYHSVSRIYE